MDSVIFVFAVCVVSLYPTETLTAVIEGPDHTPGVVGETLTLYCQVEEGLFEWTDLTTMHKIYDNSDSDDTSTSDPSKYVMDGTNLQLLDVQLSDGGNYGCKHFSERTYSDAQLVIMERPSFFLPELVEGLSVPVGCSARYGGPMPENIEGEVKPSLRLYLDGSMLNWTPNLTVAGWPGDNYVPSQLEITGEIIPDSNMDGKNLTCELSTSELDMYVATSQILNIKYAVKNIETYPVQETFYVGDVINCTSEGNPPASFKWTPESSLGGREVSHPELEIMSDMVGPNTWECTATNSVQGTQVVSTTITFQVEGGAAPGGKGSSLHLTTPGQFLCWSIPVWALLAVITSPGGAT